MWFTFVCDCLLECEFAWVCVLVCFLSDSHSCNQYYPVVLLSLFLLVPLISPFLGTSAEGEVREWNVDEAIWMLKCPRVPEEGKLPLNRTHKLVTGFRFKKPARSQSAELAPAPASTRQPATTAFSLDLSLSAPQLRLWTSLGVLASRGTVPWARLATWPSFRKTKKKQKKQLQWSCTA